MHKVVSLRYSAFLTFPIFSDLYTSGSIYSDLSITINEVNKTVRKKKTSVTQVYNYGMLHVYRIRLKREITFNKHVRISINPSGHLVQPQHVQNV